MRPLVILRRTFSPRQCRRLALSTVLGALLASGLRTSAQATTGALPVPVAGPTTPPVAWETIAIHPHDPGDQNMNWNDIPNGLSMKGVELRALLSQAYGFFEPNLRDDQLIGLPGWAKDATYDVSAHVAAEDVAAYKKATNMSMEESIRHLANHEATPDMLMMRSLLEERFGLRAHYEVKQQPVYEMVLDKGGPRLEPSTEAKGNAQWSPGTIKGRGIATQFLAMMLTMPLQRTVIDRTGLVGRFDFDLHYLPENTPPKPDNNDPDLLTAVREQLGLRLESSKGPVLILVIDAVHPPTPN